MSDLIRVLGDDPIYQGRKTYMWIDSRVICKVYPVYVEKGEDGSLWSCTADHPNATLLTYTLIDVNGQEYSCGKEPELQKLGITAIQKKPMGFVRSKETGKEIEVDPVTESET
jgi:hypothetical protein